MKKYWHSILTLFILISIFPSHVFLNQFSYDYSTELVFDSQRGIPLASGIEAIAKKLYKHLDKSLYFDTSFVKEAQTVRAYHIKPKYNKSNVGHLYTVTTKDGIDIDCTYFDRGSDTIAFIGSGFTNPREYVTPFVDLVDCDVVLFDFRGHGFKNKRNLNLAKKLFGIDSRYTTLGLKEELDTLAVVNFFKKRKKYKQTIGISVCYGALIFIKAQALYPGLFDKLVLDGCWVSLDLIREKLHTDLKIISDPQNGGWKDKWPLTKKWVRDSLEWISFYILKMPIYNDVTILPFLEKIKETPLLFFYGKDDIMVTRNEWETIWTKINPTCPKTAIITSNPHVRNHFKQKELYKLLVDLFIAFKPKDFQRLLESKQNLQKYLIQMFIKELEV
ncbi:MAG: alpha/beta hydrolase [bacterium]